MLKRKKILNLFLLILCASVLFFFSSFYPFKNDAQVQKKQISQQNNVRLVAKKKDFFVEYRLDRERLRSKQTDFLEEIIHDQTIDSNTKKEVNERLLKMNEIAEKELNIENMVKAKGYEDAIAIVHDGCIDIIIRAENLLADDVAVIGSIAVKNTGIDLEHIVIISKAG